MKGFDALGAGIGFVLILLLVSIRSSRALFEGCDRKFNLKADTTAVFASPYYPRMYPAGSSCRYTFVVPLDYEILTECMLLSERGSNNCTTEFFYISAEGDRSLTGAEQFCGTGNITRTSLFRNLVIAYISTTDSASSKTGVFKCRLTTRPQACDCGWTRNTRIVGGVETGIGEFPAMVGLLHVPSGRVFCGGAIISHRAVLTAVHCTQLFSDPSEVLLLAGDHNVTSSTESQYAANYTISYYIEHTNYNPQSNTNDIAILMTTLNIEWSRGVGPICLPFDQLNNTFDYTNVNVVGWGTTSFAGMNSDTLQKASVNVLPNSACQSVYPNLEPSQVCTYFPDRDACQFDSGGPVVFKGSARQFLLGVISYGFACGLNPGVNTRVTSFINWIQNYQVGALCPKPFS